ncbi:hypothetical protein [Tengunoibacter tsumagoiensis]|uniref:Uncharacterized protein n=1 Tax=Tengunoibacter tsumagoiensis TaxID=2014871 RepID=A0A401ZWA8_9CHLR|nr:hypothetical protein [Tengunoibacter tsumagoiensis]GCE11191.1 hypothetical protein KTT_10500 [Tengunoibacter tsumagoiensis]
MLVLRWHTHHGQPGSPVGLSTGHTAHSFLIHRSVRARTPLASSQIESYLIMQIYP